MITTALILVTVCIALLTWFVFSHLRSQKAERDQEAADSAAFARVLAAERNAKREFHREHHARAQSTVCASERPERRTGRPVAPVRIEAPLPRREPDMANDLLNLGIGAAIGSALHSDDHHHHHHHHSSPDPTPSYDPPSSDSGSSSSDSGSSSDWGGGGGDFGGGGASGDW